MDHNNYGVAAPRYPKIPDTISLDQILPAVRRIAKRKQRCYEYPGLDVQPGRKFLLLADSTSDKMVMEALSTAVREGGGILETIILQGNPGMTDPLDLLDAQFSRNWLNDWVWQAILEADVVIQSLFLLINYTPNTPVKKSITEKTSFITMYLTSDLCLPQYQSFPVELSELLDEKTWQALVHSEKMELTDAEGTDLTWSVSREQWDHAIERDLEKLGTPYRPGHLMIPLPGLDAEGTLATSSITFGGPVDRARMTIHKGQVTGVEGSGKFPEVLKSSFKEFKDIKSPRLPGPGINWWTTMAIGTHPKARIASSWDKMSGSGRMHAWGAGHSRSGVIHTSLGEGVVSDDHRIIRHVNLYFPTLIADGKKIIDRGHLTSLDDPDIIKRAEEFGNPADLLKEDWIPAVSGVIR